MIVHEDADLEGAVDAAIFGIFFNTGQVCNASSRLLLHERDRRRVPRAVCRRDQSAAYRHARRVKTRRSALSSAVSRWSESSPMSSSARKRAQILIYGGERLTGDLETGYFVGPTDLRQRRRVDASRAGRDLRTGARRRTVQTTSPRRSTVPTPRRSVCPLAFGHGTSKSPTASTARCVPG